MTRGTTSTFELVHVAYSTAKATIFIYQQPPAPGRLRAAGDLAYVQVAVVPVV